MLAANQASLPVADCAPISTTAVLPAAPVAATISTRASLSKLANARDTGAIPAAKPTALCKRADPLAQQHGDGAIASIGGGDFEPAVAVYVRDWHRLNSCLILDALEMSRKIIVIRYENVPTDLL